MVFDVFHLNTKWGRGILKKIIFAILILVAFGFFITLFEKRASQDKELAKEIDVLLEQGETEIDLTSLTDFNWTQVNVFQPYTTNEDIEHIMAIEFKGDNGGIDLLDDRYLLVFANEKRAIKTVVLSRKHGIYRIINQKDLIVEK